MRAAAQERARVRRRPGIVDHDQHAPLGQQLLETDASGLDIRETGTLAGNDGDQVFNAAERLARALAQRHPQHAVIVGVLDLLVGAERPGEVVLP
ncbi:MAG: hypothetical protein U1E52_06045 [Geminicoccaceae bacterium]